MAKIKTEKVRGEFQWFEYEIHYSSPKNGFYPKNWSSELDGVMGSHMKALAKESDVLTFMNAKIKEYEEALNTKWTLYILYAFEGNHNASTGIGNRGNIHHIDFANQLKFDYRLVYYTESKKHFVKKDDWDRAERNNEKIDPQPVFGVYDMIDKYRNSCKIIKHTPELELFFDGIKESMGKLLTKISAVFDSDDKILELANAQKLLM